MKSLRETCDTLGIPAFPWSYDFLTWEQNAVVADEIYINLGLSFAAIFVISFLLIANPLSAILVTFLQFQTAERRTKIKNRK